MRVVLAGGGTAGHVNPAVAIASALDDGAVTFFGTARGAEARIVPARGGALETIEIRGFDRSRPWSFFGTGWVAARAIFRARSLLKAHRADVVVGMGGYVSLPVCLAARSVGVPVVLHEQNIVLGLANRATKSVANKVAVSFEETLPQAGSKGVFTGNPVLPELVGLDRAALRSAAIDRFDLQPHRKTLLVFGGSQGARRINDAAAGLSRRWSDRDDLQVLHVTGRTAYEEILVKAGEAPAGRLLYRVVPYVEAMGEAYSVADIALCRGGATTVAELCVTGVPSVIVPYPYHRDKQQERHGHVLERAGAAIVLDDAETNTDSVAELIGKALTDDERLGSMRSAALALGRPEAAAHVARLVREVIR